MPADISGFAYKILADGYELDGDQSTGWRATVPYLIAWEDAFAFADEVAGLNSATTIGAITYKVPYRFPVSSAPIYAQRIKIQPCGARGEPEAPYKGLAPGEFFTHAKVTVDFAPLPLAQQAADSPLHQLDPSNPITVCRQSVRAAGKMETIKAGNYVYVSDGKKVNGDYAVPNCESVLELEFPEIPFLPWQLVRPYINKINSGAMLGVGAGELLLEGMHTKVEATTQGMSQMIVLNFAVTASPGRTWNHLPRPNGDLDLVRRAGSGDPMFYSANFADIFAALHREAA